MLFGKCLRQALEIRRLSIRCSELLDVVEESTRSLEAANDLIDGWKRRAEVLYDMADPLVRDGVLQVVTEIERLP